MRALRQRPGPPLEIVRATPGDTPPPAAAAAIYVIQNRGLSDTPRLVVLGGDPRAPFAERPGIAVLEFHPGEWSPEERLEVIRFLEAKARAKWEAAQRLEAELDAFVRREQLALVTAPRRGRQRGARARCDGGAA